MKRGKGLRADPAKTAAWLARSRKPLKTKKPLRAKKQPERKGLIARLKRLIAKTKIPKTNPKRLRRLRAMQFGTDGKREWILAQASLVSGRWGHENDPMTPSHVLGSRATGGGPDGMVPMLASENTNWDALPDAVWLEKYGCSKAWVRDMAPVLDAQWAAKSDREKQLWKERLA